MLPNIFRIFKQNISIFFCDAWRSNHRGKTRRLKPPRPSEIGDLARFIDPMRLIVMKRLDVAR
jgi:hypothetical protein